MRLQAAGTKSTAPRDDEKGVDKVALRHFRDKVMTETAVLERDLRFFRRHRHRLRYASLKAKGCGSGVVEAVNKVLVNQRMKRRSGAGDQNVLAVRAMSGRFDAT